MTTNFGHPAFTGQPRSGQVTLVSGRDIGTDYGHGDTSSELNPISRFKAMEGLSDEVKRKILFDNPKNLYGI
jgi:hypothetical protein